MGHRTAARGFAILVCAPFGRDAESVVALLTREGYRAEAVASLAELAGRLDDALGAALITEEALAVESSAFTQALADQEPWSDLPIILLAAPRATAVSWPQQGARLALPDSASNVVVLERPLGSVSLVSAVAAATKARQRQFEIRDHIYEQRRAAETLDLQVKARTADLELALERLRAEIGERERAEEQLRQAQKMEAVGQLTGGIAHDFNNMLTGVMGSLDIIGRRIKSGRLDDLDRFMEAASSSAQRAANLTQRLLAFARRQSLDARPVDVNQLVGSLEELLKRTIGETIRLETRFADDLAPCVVDANQLESAIINLAINARDAMPEGGALTVSTARERIAGGREIEGGDFVSVTVADTGCGMSQETLNKVFEPFFTTKPIGQGTGLGLSMVYGFAKQSGGQVRIDSRPGEGTAVTILLPASAEGAAAEPSARPSGTAPRGHGEAVLVVEDEPAVRQLLLEAMRELGYAALEASEATGALAILGTDREFDLLISDVGLPGMNGRKLADEARRLRPGLPVLFVTAYAQSAESRGGYLGPNMSMITKPFTLEILATRIRELLDRPAVARSRQTS